VAEVFLSYNEVISSMGFDTKSLIDGIEAGKHGLSLLKDARLVEGQTYCSKINHEEVEKRFSAFDDPKQFTRLERLLILAIRSVLEQSGIRPDTRTGLIISTTKGNIDVLDPANGFQADRAYLPALGKVIQSYFDFKEDAVIISNACVSGILALSVAKRFINIEKYDQVIVCAGDLLSDFILSGFNSFQALSNEPCRPYCKNRKGINIGELAAAVLVTKHKEGLAEEALRALGTGSANDANHISGPSRTGEGLFRSITSAMKESGLDASGIHYISAHGTATDFNDNMEAIAFHRSGLGQCPLNSLKGYVGHTLGASGLMEAIVGMHSLNRNMLFSSLGFQESGVSEEIAVIKETRSAELRTFLKTASGFGGVNTAAIFEKVKH